MKELVLPIYCEMFSDNFRGNIHGRAFSLCKSELSKFFNIGRRRKLELVLTNKPTKECYHVTMLNDGRDEAILRIPQDTRKWRVSLTLGGEIALREAIQSVGSRGGVYVQVRFP